MTWNHAPPRLSIGFDIDKIGLIVKDPSAAAISRALCTLEILALCTKLQCIINPRSERMTACPLIFSRSWMACGHIQKAVASRHKCPIFFLPLALSSSYRSILVHTMFPLIICHICAGLPSFLPVFGVTWAFWWLRGHHQPLLVCGCIVKSQTVFLLG